MSRLPTDYEDEERYAEDWIRREREIDKAEHDREREKDE